jgi:hypothetical protein
MKLGRLLVTFALFGAFFTHGVVPCGPGYTTPVFDTDKAPETPYSDYAAGRLGIVKPTFRRSVLMAAYRWLNGAGLTPDEQQAMVDVWKAEIDNKDFADTTVDDAVTQWLDKRKQVMDKEEKPPAIYGDRSTGESYDFFPNCTRNAFETASDTLSDRVSAHGPTDAGVVDWVKAQDQVFGNCASGKQTPDDAQIGAPDWLQKDRAYQKAAAKFYSMDYAAAKQSFSDIAHDFDSPWRETADYLVARTLIRQASLMRNAKKSDDLYDEAQVHIEHNVSPSGKFGASAERLVNLIAYRRHPQQRVVELGRKLGVRGANDNFRQDVIDYNWLLDKFGAEALDAEAERKAAEEAKLHPEQTPVPTPVPTKEPNPNELQLSLYAGDKNYEYTVKVDASDADVIAAAERAVGRSLTDSEKKQVQAQRQSMYSSRFKDSQTPEYEGGYWGEEKLTPSILPEFLRGDDMTDWLFSYQMTGPEAASHSLAMYKAGGSQLWLMTALSQADNSSPELKSLLDAADRADRSGAAFPTIAYHEARLLLATGKQPQARKLIEDVLASGDVLNTSARNSFITLRLSLAKTMEDWIRDSMVKPYAFDFDGEVGNIDEFIAEQKKWFDPEYNKEGKEAYERGIEDQFKDKKLWQDRPMFDDPTIEALNQHFPTPALLQVKDSPALPDYMKERFVLAVWTRAWLLRDDVTLNKMTPELVQYHPDFQPYIDRVAAAKTPAARENALLFFVLKNPILNPYIPNGIGRTDNEQDQWSDDNWWCALEADPNEGGDSGDPTTPPIQRPAFLTPAQSTAASAERKRLADIGDAPKFLADSVMAWAKRSPLDKRVPEALYIVIEANGWTKYGCGNNEELKASMLKYLKAHYAGNEFIKKIDDEEAGNQ